MTSTLSSCDTDLLQFIALTYVICHRILSPVLAVRASTVHISLIRDNSKCVIFQERPLKVLKCYNFLWVQRRHKCSPAASFANCVMTLYLLKVHLQTFLFIPVTQKCQILGCDTLVADYRYAILQAGYSPNSDLGGPGSISNHCLWEFRRSKWH